MSRYTQHKGYKSPVYKILAGVSQGSVLAPLLYIVFIDDIVDFFRKRGRYISITTATTIATLLFADDLALPTGILMILAHNNCLTTFVFMLLLHAFVLTLLKQSSWMPLFHLLPRSLLPPPSSYLLLPVPITLTFLSNFPCLLFHLFVILVLNLVVPLLS